MTIEAFPNSPRFFVRPKGSLWEIIDSTTGLYELASNDEARMREYCHGFNFPSDGSEVWRQCAYASFANDCAKYGCD